MNTKKFTQSDFGIAIKIKLLYMGKTQEWLIAEVKKDTGMFLDSSYLYRIMTAQNHSPKIIASINKILNQQ